MRSISLLAAILPVAFGLIGVATHGTATAADPIFSLADPRGDDHGDGALKYPLSHHYADGELDLVSFSARPEKDGTRFEVVFARPIRKPGKEVIDAGGKTLDREARFGFYTMNVDVYIDMDRVPGSGRTGMLPGRRTEVDSATAWERVVVVTPLPHESRSELGSMRLRAARDSVDRAAPREEEGSKERLERETSANIDSTVFFVTQIRVTGPKLQFFVPGSFLGGPARGSWAYVVAISAADLVRRFSLGGASFLGSTQFAEGLAILPVGPGFPEDRLGGGRERDELQAPLLDILIAPGLSQERVLGDYDRHARRPARLRGAVPAETSR
jgi:C-terminal binding-module, SLH-like, of glucodextranase